MESVKEKGGVMIMTGWRLGAGGIEVRWTGARTRLSSVLLWTGLLKSRVVFGANIEALAAREKSRVPVWSLFARVHVRVHVRRTESVHTYIVRV